MGVGRSIPPAVEVGGAARVRPWSKLHLMCVPSCPGQHNEAGGVGAGDLPVFALRRRVPCRVALLTGQARLTAVGDSNEATLVQTRPARSPSSDTARPLIQTPPAAFAEPTDQGVRPVGLRRGRSGSGTAVGCEGTPARWGGWAS
jgi:hypothetical protein